MSDHHHDHHHDTAALTKNQSLVMGQLSSANGPLSAYTILDRLREHGFRAPLQVYRALDKLVEFGMVHRLESLNAFVACRQPGCDTHETIAFTICETCGQVAELSDPELADHLKALAAATGFVLKKSTVELRGLCRACGRA
ncbi:Fur family zinc uptake transcriptional regulator [Hoeflea marina]|uniref:Fur family zinc uptake transcriptional regulator n=1 Tax=Hoeflea marina TaxID=274592 RepID=A0A317PQ16_9HYPH|nr:Fur family transcriptional regulator [Hoeflea marina]PWW01670.1 Fur family zinc uptake transcriptional regulator [Hoeflea marina]